MIRVTPQPEPADFEVQVRQAGARAMAEQIGEIPPFPRTGGQPFKRVEVKVDGVLVKITRREDIPSSKLPTYWREALGDLKTAYGHICAYCGFRIHLVTGNATVDHMAPKSRSWDRVYEWSNYRLAAGILNAAKNDFEDVLDPFEVEDGWFQLELVGFQVRPAPGLPAEQVTAIDATIERLDLNRPELLERREELVTDYQSQDLTLRIVQRESPFIARELQRLGLT